MVESIKGRTAVKSVEKRGLLLTGRSYAFLAESWILEPQVTNFRMNKIQEIDGSAEDASPWWAIYTRHQHEKTVAQVLATKGFDVFLPLYDSVRRWKDRSKTLSMPLFPCYVFVRGGLSRRLHVLTTPGVHTILYHGERIAIIPNGEIDAVRRVVESPSRVEPHPFLRCGETVRVTRGSLEGVQGVLVRKKSMYRLVLSVEMLAQSVAVEIDATDVEPVKGNGLTGILPQPENAGTGSPNDLFSRGTRLSASALSHWTRERKMSVALAVAETKINKACVIVRPGDKCLTCGMEMEWIWLHERQSK
jgi:transcription antitermination factor NusG